LCSTYDDLQRNTDRYTGKIQYPNPITRTKGDLPENPELGNLSLSKEERSPIVLSLAYEKGSEGDMD
jgi:hypothetical protein